MQITVTICDTHWVLDYNTTYDLGAVFIDAAKNGLQCVFPLFESNLSASITFNALFHSYFATNKAFLNFENPHQQLRMKQTNIL